MEESYGRRSRHFDFFVDVVIDVVIDVVVDAFSATNAKYDGMLGNFGHQLHRHFLVEQ